MNRIAPNNQLPATHFIEVWRWEGILENSVSPNCIDIKNIDSSLKITKDMDGNTIAIFRIRENKLPTKHKF